MRSPTHSIDQYKDKTIAIIGGGISAEREVSFKSAQNVASSFRRLGLTFVELDPVESSFFNTPFDIAFNCLHGRWGEDGGLQGYCEVRQIAYTGPGIKAAAIGLNKPVFKAVMIQNGIPTPKQLFEPVSFPFISKPTSEGSSIGITLVNSKDQWEALVKKTPDVIGSDYFLEEYINGQEVTSGVIKINGEIVVLPILEIQTTCEFYNYEGKYTSGKTTYIIPANISKKLSNQIKQVSKQIYKLFDCKGCIRIDFMIDQGEAKVLEMNTSPGITAMSNIPAQAEAMGISMDELVLYYLDSAK